ncbi:MAG: hypothetical protein ACFFDS_05595 [Candidatus Thorarchaeota archaeon]
MVHNPFDTEDSTDDPRKAKLREQAQKEFIAQLQQRIANQTAAIEELQKQIVDLNAVIAQKDQELTKYSSRVEEERLYFEQDKKARGDREYELQNLLKEKEKEVEQLKNRQIPSAPVAEVIVEKKDDLSDPTNDYISKMMSFFKRPTNEIFVEALTNLIEHSGENGTDEQKILGVLLKEEMPQTEEDITQKTSLNPQEVNRALFRLVQKENVKKVGKGYVLISSDFAEMTDVSQNWGGLAPVQIFENLLSVVYVGSNREELVEAFTKARDALMEMGALTTTKRHELSQLLEKIKRYPIESQELIDTIQTWKSETTE